MLDSFIQSVFKQPFVVKKYSLFNHDGIVWEKKSTSVGNFYESTLICLRHRHIHSTCSVSHAHHIFLSPRWRVVLSDLQLQHVPLPIEGKAAKELHHSALISECKQLTKITKRGWKMKKLWEQPARHIDNIAAIVYKAVVRLFIQFKRKGLTFFNNL